MNKTNRSRRRFLERSLGCTLLGSGAAAMNGKLNLVGSALAASSDYAAMGDYRSLVCVFLYGGIDSFNMVVPLDGDRYGAYRAARGSLAIDNAQLLATADGQMGFNMGLPLLRNAYDDGTLAVVGNVGNLITPVERGAYLSGSVSIPADLFAHNHQQEQWQKGFASRPASLVGSGWGGRMADLLREANNGANLPPTLSMAGANFFQPGASTAPISINPQTGPRLMNWMDGTKSSANAGRDTAMAEILAMQQDSLMKQFSADSYRTARDSSRLLSQVLASNAPSTENFYTQDSNVGDQMKMVARLIAGREQLGMKRQIFFVGMGGWDTHDYQSRRFPRLMRDLNTALSSFSVEMKRQGVDDSVTAFTASDFGRTLTVNGDGSDHGWGGHYMVMGGAVNGGNLVGDWPSYDINGRDDSGDKGRVIPSMSVNQYGASLASWMGLSNSDILDVFPDLSNFDAGWQAGGAKPRYGLFT